MDGSEKPDAHTCLPYLLTYLYSAHGGCSPNQVCSLVSGPGTQKKKQKEVLKHRGASLIPSLCHYLLPLIAYRAIDVHVTRRWPVSSAGCIRCASFSALAGTTLLEPSRVVP